MRASLHARQRLGAEIRQARLEHEEKAAVARQKTLARELEWVRMSPKARHAKGKARVSAYEDLLARDEREQVRAAEIGVGQRREQGARLRPRDREHADYRQLVASARATIRIAPRSISFLSRYRVSAGMCWERYPMHA